MGFNCVKPAGAFYLFPETPIPDDVEFCRQAEERLVLLVPGTGFFGPGHVRLSFAMTNVGQIERALPALRELAEHFGMR
ncbi:hypothetical protein COT42_05205 [Candidatus Saganbacteria bacterium CG08_land_8_20_14_0_20_45_16]|uniref:Aminotransferase class I/classII large domain-containing protein n=1 Tax=Candidatus Saganbacteria bacterium CG08_land_8_20_14_0_20_45_16 TaxID=2014293 RepID=A0A2H0XX25_UNCSA|nr:MAG: hypothetical protein COT42_05205 [Candidatus Saganbacteria bacterium CG08_land_8_20_14_0_20_45_16]